jgi:DNA-directed RNA polymerase subunit M/transcription elongation factor TFIIS
MVRRERAAQDPYGGPVKRGRKWLTTTLCADAHIKTVNFRKIGRGNGRRYRNETGGARPDAWSLERANRPSRAAGSNFCSRLEGPRNGTAGTIAQDDVCNAVPDCGSACGAGEQTKSRLCAEHSSSATISECKSSVIETAKKSNTRATLSALNSCSECREERRRWWTQRVRQVPRRPTTMSIPKILRSNSMLMRPTSYVTDKLPPVTTRGNRPVEASC